MKQLSTLALSVVFVLPMACGVEPGTGSQGVKESQPQRNEEAETAFHQPLLDDRYKEGENPKLEEGTERYVHITSKQEGTPVLVYVESKIGGYYFNARTPYYFDLDEESEHVEAGINSVSAFNGNIDEPTITVEYFSFGNLMDSASCYVFECRAMVSGDDQYSS